MGQATINPMTHYRLTLTEVALRQLVTQLAADPERRAFCPAGISRLPERIEWLVHEVRGRPVDANASAAVMVVGAAGEAALQAALRAAPRQLPSGSWTAVIGIGVGPAAGRVAGWCPAADGLRPLDAIQVTGPGLPQVSLQNTSHDVPAPVGDQAVDPRAIWSRTIGALGEETWRRLRSLHVGIVGCGRTGSLVATGLRSLGVEQLTLIDPDRMEVHNLGEMDGVRADDVGQPKVHALAVSLCAQGPGPAPRIVAVPESVLALQSLAALKRTDLIICGVDSAAARLATASLAVLYLKPLLDIGSGITPILPRQMGADIRLVLPGRCLVCLGGVADFEQGRREMLTVVEPTDRRGDDETWRRQRAGSLRSLNGVAVHLGMRLLEDWVGARVRESIWLHMEIGETSSPTLVDQHPTITRDCVWCRLTALGYRGITRLRELLKGETTRRIV